MEKATCYGTHSLVARTMGLPMLTTIPLDAPSPMSVTEDEAFLSYPSLTVSSPPRPVSEDVFPLDLNANQPCPFTKDMAKEWTIGQQAICEHDMKKRSASTVEELRELVSFFHLRNNTAC